MAKITREDALEYHHLKGKPGKIAVVPTKPMDTQRDLSLAYTPGVAEPVLDIEKDPELPMNIPQKATWWPCLPMGRQSLVWVTAGRWLPSP